MAPFVRHSRGVVRPLLMVGAALGLVAAPCAGQVGTRAYRVLGSESILAVVTHGAGIAGRLAHEHLVVASGHAIRLGLSVARPDEAEFHASVPADSLVVDDPRLRSANSRRLLELGIVEAALEPLSEEDRAKIRGEMLATGQLDSSNHPHIEVHLAQARLLPDTARILLVGDEFPWHLEVDIQAGGGSARVSLMARMIESGDTLEVEAVGQGRFSDLGIDAYSAFLGMVKVDDGFHLYLHLRAVADDHTRDDVSPGAPRGSGRSDWPVRLGHSIALVQRHGHFGTTPP